MNMRGIEIDSMYFIYHPLRDYLQYMFQLSCFLFNLHSRRSNLMSTNLIIYNGYCQTMLLLKVLLVQHSRMIFFLPVETISTSFVLVPSVFYHVRCHFIFFHVLFGVIDGTVFFWATDFPIFSYRVHVYFYYRFVSHLSLGILCITRFLR